MEIVITIVLFIVVYLLLFVGWARVISKTIGKGPIYDLPATVDNEEGMDFADLGVDEIGEDVDEIIDDAPEGDFEEVVAEIDVSEAPEDSPGEAFEETPAESPGKVPDAPEDATEQDESAPKGGE